MQALLSPVEGVVVVVVVIEGVMPKALLLLFQLAFPESKGPQ